MKKLNPGDNVFIKEIQHFARVLEVDGDNIKVTYTIDVWGKHKGVVEIRDRKEMQKFGDPTPIKESKTTPKTSKSKLHW